MKSKNTSSGTESTSGKSKSLVEYYRREAAEKKKEESKANGEADGGDNPFNVQSITDKSEEFIQQAMFAEYFLMSLGCIVPNVREKIGIEHKQLKDYKHKHLKEWSDSLFYDYSQFNAILSKKTITTSNDANEMMINMVQTVMKLLEAKMVCAERVWFGGVVFVE